MSSSGREPSPIYQASIAAEVADRKFLAAIASSLPWERWAADIGYVQFQVVRVVAMMDRFGHGDEEIRSELDLSAVDLLQIRKTVVYAGLTTEIARLIEQSDSPVDVGDVIRGEAPKLVRDMIVTARISGDDELRTGVVRDLLDREYPKKGREAKPVKERVLVLPERVIAALASEGGSGVAAMLEEPDNDDDDDDGEG